MTTATVEVAAGVIPPAPAPCPPWCTANHDRPDPDGEYHHGTVAELTATDLDMGREYKRTVRVGLDRLDGDDEDVTRLGAVSVCVETSPTSIDSVTSMTPVEALALAKELVRAAFLAATELELPALDVRLGDEISTADGWQIVESILINTVGPAVELFTVEQYGTDRGERYAPTALVRVRREVTR